MDQPRMNRSLIAWGLACFAGGAAMILAGIGVIPLHPRAGDAPAWLAAVIGLAFASAGLAMILLGFGRGSPATGVLPPDAPRWMRIAQAGLGLGVIAALATTISWVAFGPGQRAFSISGPVSGAVNEIAGRAAFGLGAVFAWLCLAFAARQALRSLKAGPWPRKGSAAEDTEITEAILRPHGRRGPSA